MRMPKSKPFKELSKPSKKKPAGISGKVINLIDIYTLIAQKKYPSVEFLMERFGLGERSVYRYLEIIKQLDAIEYDVERQGYKFVTGDRIKKLLLSKEQFMLLLVMGDTVSHLGRPLKEEFGSFVESMTSIARVPCKDRPAIMVKLQDVIGQEKVEGWFKAIQNCIEERRQVEMVYSALYSGETEERRVEPYGLVYYEGAWLLIGYCRLRQEIRHFALDRIQSLRETNFYFKPKEDFSLEEHMSRSWGIWNEEPVEVKVRFSAKVADHITRKPKWHKSEKRELLPSGEVELTLTVAGTPEIKHWIYSWVPNVKIIEPEWLREQLKKELAEAIKQH